MDTTKNDKALMEQRIDRAANLTARVYSGSVSATDKKSLDSWLQQSEQNRQAYQAMLDTWHITGAAADRIDEFADDLYEDSDSQSAIAAGERNRKTARRLWAIAASVLLVASAALLMHYQTDNVQQPVLASYQTLTGEQKSVELKDGSVITLNTNTRVLVDYNDTERRIILQQGEAFFDVKSNPALPFTVDTGTRSITVLGTRFDVRKDGFKLKVAVVEGAVAVHRSEERINTDMEMVELLPGNNIDSVAEISRYRLQSGMLAEFFGISTATDSIAVQAIENSANYPGWRYGAIDFNSQPLYRVVKELNRYTRKKLLIEDSRIMDLQVSGVFQLQSIEKALRNLAGALPLQIVEYPDRIVIVSATPDEN